MTARNTHHDAPRARRNVPPTREAHRLQALRDIAGPDFNVSGGGSLYLIHPLSEAARDWLRDNVEDGAQYLGRALAVEHRYIAALVDGMLSAGLSCE